MVDNEVRIGVLEHAQELLSLKNRWLQGEMCADEDGVACEVTSPEAVSFCLLGAIRRSCYDLGHIASDRIDDEKTQCPFSVNPVYEAVLGDIRCGPPGSSSQISRLEEGVGSFNDEGDTRYADILAVLARAIRGVEVEEGLEGTD